jgi:hypothetical protein
MTRRTLPLVLVLLLALVGCQGDDGGQAAPTTTATTVATTTTRPDPAEEGCRTLGADPSDAVPLLRLSSNERIAEAAKQLDDAIDLAPTGELAKAVEEIVYACRAAGYET